MASSSQKRKVILIDDTVADDNVMPRTLDSGNITFIVAKTIEDALILCDDGDEAISLIFTFVDTQADMDNVCLAAKTWQQLHIIALT